MLEHEILDNLKNTLAGLHGKQLCDPSAYGKAIREGLTPEVAWAVFEGTIREVDCWQEMEDVDELMKVPA